MRPRTRFRDTAAPGKLSRAAARGGGAARPREGAPGAQAPPPAPARREGEAVASSQRARRGGESGGGGQAAGPGGYRVHRARGLSGRTANAVTCAAPPLSHTSSARRSLHS